MSRPRPDSRRWLPALVAALLVVLALSATFFTLNRLAVPRVIHPPLDVRVSNAAAVLYPPAPDTTGAPIVKGHRLAPPDRRSELPSTALALLELRSRATRQLTRHVMAEQLRVLEPEERRRLRRDAMRHIHTARSTLRDLLATDPLVTAGLLSALGWPWTPADLEKWKPGLAYLAESRRPVPVRQRPLDEARKARDRLETAEAPPAAVHQLTQAGWSREEVDALRVWSARRALDDLFASRQALTQGRALVQRLYALSDVQVDYVISLWAAQWLVQRNRFALPALIRVYEERPATLALVREAARRSDLDRQARQAVEHLLHGAESARAERELIALGPFALAALDGQSTQVAAPRRRQLDRLRARILSQWPDPERADGMPAARWSSWQRWLRNVRPWLW